MTTSDASTVSALYWTVALRRRIDQTGRRAVLCGGPAFRWVEKLAGATRDLARVGRAGLRQPRQPGGDPEDEDERHADQQAQQ